MVKRTGLLISINALSLLISIRSDAIDLLQSAATMWADPNAVFSIEIKTPATDADVQSLNELLKNKLGEKVTVTAPTHDGVRDIIASPLKLKDVTDFQNALNRTGLATKSTSPRVFVNLRSQVSPLHLTNILRNLTYIEHVDQIRVQGLPVLSEGFKTKIASESYRPSLRQLFTDYVYRQSLEYIGDPGAWTISENELKSALMRHPQSEIKSAMHRLSPVILPALIASFPNDNAVRALRELGYRPSSAVEISLHSSATELERSVQEASGIVAASQKYGAFDHDRLVFSQSGISEDTLHKLRAAEKSGKQTQDPIVFRYFLLDPKQPTPLGGAVDYADAAPHFEGTVLGRISTDSIGSSPVVIPGESVVFHDRTFHGSNIIGKHNPALVNRYIAQSLTANKYVEAIFWNRYVPGAMPETHLLKEFKNSEMSPSEVQRELNKRFPSGWVMKGVNESNTGLMLVTDSADLGKLVEEYKKSDFDPFREKILRDLKGHDEDEIFVSLQEHPNYKGWKIHQALSHPEHSIIQKKLQLAREFRVEAISGKVLGNGSTLDRYWYEYEAMGEKFDFSPPETIRAVEKYTQEVIDKLPPELKGTPFAFDIALLKDGTFAIVESNAGPESGFLVEWPPSIRASNAFLHEYPRLAKEGKVTASGMTDSDQMKYLKKLFDDHGIDSHEQYPGYTFRKDKLDIGIHPRSPDRSYYSVFSKNVRHSSQNCSSIVDELKHRLASPTRGL